MPYKKAINNKKCHLRPNARFGIKYFYQTAIIYTNERLIDIRASHTEHLLIAHQAIYYRTIASLMQFTM